MLHAAACTDDGIAILSLLVITALWELNPRFHVRLCRVVGSGSMDLALALDGTVGVPLVDSTHHTFSRFQTRAPHHLGAQYGRIPER